MPINQPQLSRPSVDVSQTSSPMADALASFLKGRAAEQTAAATGKQQRITDSNKDRLAQEFFKRAVDKNTPEGKLNADMREISGPNGERVGAGLGALRAGDNEAQKLSGYYQKTVQPLHDQIASMQMGLESLKKGTLSGDELSSIIKARMAEGKGSRVLGSVVQAFGAPHSLAGDAQGLANYISGIPFSKMTPAQRGALSDLYEMQTNQLDKQLQTADAQFRAQAPNQARMMASNGTLAPYLETFQNPSKDRLTSMRQTLSDLRSGKLVAPGPEQNMPFAQQAGAVVSGIPSALKSGLSNFLKGLHGGSDQSAPQVPSSGTIRVRDKATNRTGTLDASEFDPSKYDKI